MSVYVICFLILAEMLSSFQSDKQSEAFQEITGKIEIRGIYGSPNPFWNKNISMNQLNVNAIFLNWHIIDASLIERAAKEGVKVFAEFPTLNGKGYVENHPEAWPVDRFGKKAEQASWFMGVCPTEPGFRKFRMNELRQLIMKYPIDGVFLDYLHWHAQFEEPEPILPETCFCENCIRTFESEMRINVPDLSTKEQADWILSNHDKKWREWRCSVIEGWVKEAGRIVKTENQNAVLGIYHCPWNDEEFNGARYRILGLDFDKLRNITDVFSPMVYHGRMGRKPEWVRENIEWLSKRIDIKPGSFPKIWTIIQAYDDPVKISAKEFEQLLSYGTAAGASGMMMFTSNAVAESSEKTEVLKNTYSKWMTGK
jgi:hypothetical protein